MEPHGHIEIKWDTNILVVTTFGSFNIEGIKLAFEQIKQSVKASGHATWYRVDVLDQETLGSKEVMKVIGDSYAWSCLDSQCSEVAVCCSNLLQQEMLKKFIKLTSLNITVFNCIEQTNTYIGKAFVN